MHNWPLEAKVGQMMMFGFAGRKCPSRSALSSTSTTSGNHYLFSECRESEADHPTQCWAAAVGFGRPFGVGLFIAVDQEGGQARISEKG